MNPRSTHIKRKTLYYIDVVVLIAWCNLRQDFRHFRIDRILECTPNGRRFVAEGAALRDRWEKLNALP